MTDTDPRLEVVAAEVAKHRHLPSWPEVHEWTRADVYATAKSNMAWYDALRAFDQAQAAANIDRSQLQRVRRPDGSYGFPDVNKPQPESEVMPHQPERSAEDNATAPVMGADPPWFRDCIAAAHRAWLDTGASNEIINWHAIIRAVLTFASAQPDPATGSNNAQAPLPGFVSAPAGEAGDSGRLADAPWIKPLATEIRDEHFENLSIFCVETIIRKALRFANAQSEAVSELPITDYLTAQGIHTLSPPADENRPNPEPTS